MPTLDVTRNYSDGNALTQAHLDAYLDDIETFVNSTKLDSSNIQSGAITSDLIATGAVATADLADGAVTNVKITDGTINGGTKIAAGSIDNSRLSAGLISTGYLADGAVTAAKFSAAVYQISGGSSTYATSSTSYDDVTNNSVTITATGSRPVIIAMVPDNNGSASEAGLDSGVGQGILRILKDGSTEVAISTFEGITNIGGCPIAGIDVPTSGSHTYKVQAKAGSGGTIHLKQYRLFAVEVR